MPIWHLWDFLEKYIIKMDVCHLKICTHSWVKIILLKFLKKQMAAELFKDLSHKSSCLQLMDITNLLVSYFSDQNSAHSWNVDEDCSVFFNISGQIKRMKTELLENVRMIRKRKTELHFSYRNCGRTPEISDWQQHKKIL